MYCGRHRALPKQIILVIGLTVCSASCVKLQLSLDRSCLFCRLLNLVAASDLFIHFIALSVSSLGFSIQLLVRDYGCFGKFGQYLLMMHRLQNATHTRLVHRVICLPSYNCASMWLGCTVVVL